MSPAEFSRRMAKVLNSPYFYGDDRPPDRIEELMFLRDEVIKAKSVDDLSPKAREIAEAAERSIRAK